MLEKRAPQPKSCRLGNKMWGEIPLQPQPQSCGRSVVIDILVALALVTAVSYGCTKGSSTATAVPIGQTVAIGRVYCLPSSAVPAVSAVPAGYYVPTAVLTPVSGAASTIEETDGTAFYVTSITPASGALSPQVSCPFKYPTKQ